MNIWQVLEIDTTTDLKIIKVAYAKKIKICKPEVDPQAFQLLRSAYEIAVQYAQGKNVNFELVETPIPNKQEEESIFPKKFSFNNRPPEDLARELMKVLSKNEQDAIDLIEECKDKKILDNLEFSDRFQRLIAYYLLSIPSWCSYRFSQLLIEMFGWEDQCSRETLNSTYGMMLLNIINHVAPYRFYLRLCYLGSVKNKKEAIEKKLDPNECYAAKTLLSPRKYFKFFLTSRFSTKKRGAIFSLVKSIESYPQVLGMGVNISAFSWWNALRNKRKTNWSVQSIFILFFILMKFSLAHMSQEYPSNSNQAPSSSLLSDDAAKYLQPKVVAGSDTVPVSLAVPGTAEVVNQDDQKPKKAHHSYVRPVDNFVARSAIYDLQKQQKEWKRNLIIF